VAKGNRYLGVLQYKDGTGTTIGSTLMAVDAR
jgi:hypothetical protein